MIIISAGIKGGLEIQNLQDSTDSKPAFYVDPQVTHLRKPDQEKGYSGNANNSNSFPLVNHQSQCPA